MRRKEEERDVNNKLFEKGRRMKRYQARGMKNEEREEERGDI